MGVGQDGQIVRAPYLELAPHARHVALADLPALCRSMREEDPERLLAADLFSGAGGLSLGLEMSGMAVVLGCDINPEAVETHTHHFAGASLSADLGDPAVVKQVAEVLRDARIDVLAGGPPCQPFSKAGRAKIRHRVQYHLRDPYDERRDLWQSYVEIAEIAEPQAVIMENVPDMAFDAEMFVLRSIAKRLEDIGYSVDFRIVSTADYGVPQFRQRLILVALRDRLTFDWPQPTMTTTVRQAISDLPDVEGGWPDADLAFGGAPYDRPLTDFQRRMRMARPVELGRVFDHFTRSVREDDLEAFKLMDSKTKYSDLPEELRRYRSDIFDDKYKRLDWDGLSRTITAHIAKDGYWYIHPRQHRTITVREAARLQTFPDGFRFAGRPTAAFKQIGNAVPPFLGEALGRAVRQSLVAGRLVAHTHEESGTHLVDLWDRHGHLVRPWLKFGNRFQVILAETLFDRQSPTVCRFGWRAIQPWTNGATVLANRDGLLQLADWIGRRHIAEALLSGLCQLNAGSTEAISVDHIHEFVANRQISRSVADIAALAGSPEERDNAEAPVVVNQPVLRVVSRYRGDMSDNRNQRTDGRLGAARLVGFGPRNGDAHLMLLEIGRTLCVPIDPSCALCVLEPGCSFAHRQAEKDEGPSELELSY